MRRFHAKRIPYKRSCRKSHPCMRRGNTNQHNQLYERSPHQYRD
jgi:hypothetical protein